MRARLPNGFAWLIAFSAIITNFALHNPLRVYEMRRRLRRAEIQTHWFMFMSSYMIPGWMKTGDRTLIRPLWSLPWLIWIQRLYSARRPILIWYFDNARDCRQHANRARETASIAVEARWSRVAHIPRDTDCEWHLDQSGLSIAT